MGVIIVLFHADEILPIDKMMRITMQEDPRIQTPTASREMVSNHRDRKSSQVLASLSLYKSSRQ